MGNRSRGGRGEEGEVGLGRKGSTFNSGICPSALKAVLPPAAPKGVTPSSRWLSHSQNPGQGLLKEKAGFHRRRRGRGQILGTPGFWQPKACACISKGPQSHSFWWGFPETATIRGGSFGVIAPHRDQAGGAGGGRARATSPLGDGPRWGRGRARRRCPLPSSPGPVAFSV